MNIFSQIADTLAHLDTRLEQIAVAYGSWTYLLIFATVFAETGLIVAAFLPGDTLLFAAGTFAGAGHLDIYKVAVGIHVSAVLGDSANYWISRKLGHQVLVKWTKLIRPGYLRKASSFYRKNGIKAVLVSRFVPTFRTFVPFIAGLSKMKYSRFLIASLVGSALWVSVFVFGGYFFGSIPWVRKNFVLAIVIVGTATVVPSAIGVVRALMKRRIDRKKSN
ncbi:MAG: VTT domain-containing protein [Calditrichaeota bacterium]|nr:VTT domain-containing protein [Calditrichota bacterium]MCB9366514.1 VTT domain-containing protein [Calditrichota bacterium]MCB9391228.1 VTT domain-containing protein [Calditrichota bacterium]